MSLSPDTQSKMEAIGKDQIRPAPGELAVPKKGWKCPACGSVYDNEGICPVDQTLLSRVGKWTEATVNSSDATSAQVMDQADELYPV